MQKLCVAIAVAGSMLFVSCGPAPGPSTTPAQSTLNTQLLPCEPLPLGLLSEDDLARLVPDGSPGKVRLHWTTKEEKDLRGYWILRKHDVGEPFARIHPTPLAGHGQTTAPLEYCYVDQGLPRGQTFYYRVEAIDSQGVSRPIEGMESMRVNVKTVEQERKWLSDHAKETVLARVEGKPVTAGQLAAYLDLVNATEVSETSPTLEDYVVGKLLPDVYTTVPLEDKARMSCPVPIKYPPQMVYLKNALLNKLRETTGTRAAESNEQLIEEYQNEVRKALVRHGDRVLMTTPTAVLQGSVPVLELDGKVLTIRDLEILYGRVFTYRFGGRGRIPAILARFLKELIEELAGVQAALDMKLDQTPRARADLELLAERARMLWRVRQILAAERQVPQDRLDALYTSMADELRRPEVGGWIITIDPVLDDIDTTDPAVIDAAAEVAKKKAQEAAERLRAGEDFEKVARELSTDNVATSGGYVRNHFDGEIPASYIEAFDYLTSGMTQRGQMSEMTTMGLGHVIAKFRERTPGHPMPYREARTKVLERARTLNYQHLMLDLVDMFENKGWLTFTPESEKYRIRRPLPPIGVTTRDGFTTGGP